MELVFFACHIERIFHASNDRFVIGIEFNYVTRSLGRDGLTEFPTWTRASLSTVVVILEKSIVRESMNNIACETLNLFCRALSTYAPLTHTKWKRVSTILITHATLFSHDRTIKWLEEEQLVAYAKFLLLAL